MHVRAPRSRFVLRREVGTTCTKWRGNPPRRRNTWANYACRDNTIWDQVTSNMAESVNNMVGHEVCLPLLHYT